MPRQGGVSLDTAKWWIWAAQLALAALVAWFVWQSVAGDLGEFRSLRSLAAPIELRLGPVALAAAVVWGTYGMLIAAWRTVLSGWRQHLTFPSAVRIWCISNLGRYLPGKVWSIAGLAVLARREGVHGLAAGGSAVVMQAMAVGTGAAVALAFLPQIDSAVSLVAGLAVAAVSVTALTSKPIMRWLARLTRTRAEIDPLPTRTVVLGAGTTLAAWLMYGLAFWLLAQGLTPDSMPTLELAVGAFAAGYIVGLLAVFAPGGVVVRESVLVGLLVPSIGTGPALVLSIGSRLLLTVTEIVAALVGLMIRPRNGGEA